MHNLCVSVNLTRRSLPECIHGRPSEQRQEGRLDLSAKMEHRLTHSPKLGHAKQERRAIFAAARSAHDGTTRRGWRLGRKLEYIG